LRDFLKGSSPSRDFEHRPLSCGNCFECDNCYGICPDNAVIKLGPGNRFKFDYDFCKCCGLCAQECPCGAIMMVPEAI
jgi:2-oxoacid:acceptor oxidoreductase delta subunit (pyruvate/2-ketoisovalerate family)